MTLIELVSDFVPFAPYIFMGVAGFGVASLEAHEMSVIERHGTAMSLLCIACALALPAFAGHLFDEAAAIVGAANAALCMAFSAAVGIATQRLLLAMANS